ncbi:MAG TPA: peptidoglycan DD-metalloendopeptidase family protein [Alcanivoracaceae bacterium]|nr:peptidoglycan DD-metalloendopeptidase family protein [Alcanivoracaceae bacterium]
MKLLSTPILLAYFITALALLANEPVSANDTASPEELRQLRSRIQALQQQHDRDLKKRDNLAHLLREQDKRIAQLTKTQNILRIEQREAKERLATAEERQAAMIAEQSTQLRWLKKTAQALYQQGSEPKLKLLLNQEQPDQISRMLRYHDYFQKARHARLTEIKKELATLIDAIAEVRAAREHLTRQEDAVTRKHREIQQAQEERKKSLANLNKSITNQATRLQRMREDAAHLDRLLKDMQRSTAQMPVNPSGTPFKQLRGKLPWPAVGRIKANYNSIREGNIRWSGILLDVPDGTPVRAIHAGRVSYTDWVRGYGLITIIDHGDSYLSLYGHSQTLLKEVGDWVNPGDVIALAGNSGSADRSGIYLEIRHRGQTINPRTWIR